MPTDGADDAAALRAALRDALRACRGYRRQHPPRCDCAWCRAHGWVRSDTGLAAALLARVLGALGPQPDPPAD